MKLAQWLGVTVGMLMVGAGLVTGWAVMSKPPAATSAAVNAGQAATADDAVQQALRNGKPTIAEFGANACAQCREMAIVLDGLKRQHGERITVVSVDLIKQRDSNYVQRYGIQLMPTQIFFDAQGREIGRNLGKISADEILAKLQAPLRAPAAGGGSL